MTIKRALAAALAATVAATAALPAAAQSIASASLGNMTWQLIDLTPDDGIAPYITFTGSTATFATSYLYADTVFTDVADTSTSFGTDLSSTSVSNADGTSSAYASLYGVSADTQSLRNSGFSLSYSTMDFVLSPNTRVIFTADAHVNALPDFSEGGLGYAYASVLLYGEVANNSSGGVTNFSSSVFSFRFDEQRPLSAVVDSQGQEAYGWIGMQAISQSMSLQPLSPVPEPASVAMLLGGLALLGGRARRREGWSNAA